MFAKYKWPDQIPGQIFANENSVENCKKNENVPNKKYQIDNILKILKINGIQLFLLWMDFVIEKCASIW